MSAYKSNARKIKDGLVTILSGITLDAGSGAEPAFAVVTDDPAKEFSAGSPYILVFPGPLETVKSSVGENDRTYNYKLIMVLPFEDGQSTQEATYNQMYDLSELIFDSLDEADWHNTLNSNDTSLSTILLNATLNTPTPADSKGGAILLCVINVAATYIKDL